MTAQHTPGPWAVGAYGALGGIDNEDTFAVHPAFSEAVIAVVWPWGDADGNFGGSSVQRANARLIAAAPDLLAALEAVDNVIELVECGDPQCSDASPCVGRIVRAAIAQATGKDS